MSEYKNATDILPEELIKEIHKYFNGGMLWVPVKGTDRRERDEIIVNLKKNGVTTTEIARLARLTPRHIRRIMLKHNPDEAGADTK